MSLEWMAWTPVTAVFFATIAALLIVMTLWELWRPSLERKGFLPIPTTRGDRLFLGLVSAAAIHVAWIYATDAPDLWVPLAASTLWGAVMMRFG